MGQLFLIVIFLMAFAILVALFLAERRHRVSEDEHSRIKDEELRVLLRHGKMGIWHYWPKEKRFRPEKNWFELVGCEPQQCSDLREQFYKHIHESDRGRVEQSFLFFLTQKSPIYHEIYILETPHRGEVWIEEFGHIITRDDDGNPLEFVGVCRDITSEKSGEHDRLRRDAMLQAVASSGHLEFWTWDIGRDQVEIDPLFSELPDHRIDQRYSSKEFFGEIFPDDRESFEKGLKDFLTGKTGILNIEFRRKFHKDGKSSWEWMKVLSVVYLRDGHGKPSKVAGIFLDVDESKTVATHLQEDEIKLKALELELKSKEEELEQLSHSLLHSVSSLGKEVRSPLNVMLGIVERMREHEEDSERIYMLESLKNSSKLIFKIVNEMVDIMRLQTQEFHLENTPLNLQQLLQSLFVPEGQDVGNEEYYKYDGAISSHIYGDSRRLKQILKDCRHFLTGGDESVRVRLMLELVYLDGLPYLGLEMSNPDTAKRISDAQVTAQDHQMQLHQSKKIERTIGLTIAEKMVSLMEGSISFEQSANSGNLIKMVIPYLPHKVSEESEKVVSTSIDFSQTDSTILIVDDSEANRELIRIYLSEFPFTFLMAKDGAEAVQLFQKQKIDLILMDIQMPIMDGREAIQIIRSIEKTESRMPIPIIALSAYVMHEEIDQCLDDGSSSVLLKPVKKGILLEEMAKFISSGEEHGKA